MKNCKQILEAVNRGIQLALDDFDDEQVQNIKSKQVQNRDYTKEYLDLMKDVVDLGLPSGTLWCKYNLDVNPNQLTKAEDWYGKYYAWGELKPNKTKKKEIYFDWSNYKYGKDFNKLTKYCNDSLYGLKWFKDNLTKLLPEDDVAYQFKKCHNFKFHIPTEKQYEELIDYTKNYWIKNYDPNKIKHNPEDDKGIQGLNVRVFTGFNGNTLFIPAAGYRYGSDFNNVGSCCHLWSSSLHVVNPSIAYTLNFNSGSIGIYSVDRCFGFAIRPVINL